MFKRAMITGALTLAAPAVAVLAFTSSAGAADGSNAAQNLSFLHTSDGASAHWSRGVGSPIELTIGNTPGSYAAIVLHHLPPTPVSDLAPDAPTFTTTNYAAGSPRYYLTLSDGNTLWGYPSNSGLNGSSSFAWAINNGSTYMSWSAIQESAEADATVTGAMVIMDADQSPGTTDKITDLTFGDIDYN